MKITSVRTAVIDGNFPWVLVRIETDEGITGLGEAYWGVGVAELVHKAGPLIVGENPFNIGKITELLIRCLSGEGSSGGATVTAISGIEIALWDLVGRALNTPIYNLFGGRFRDQIRVYADCHAGATPDPASYAERAKSVAGAGFTAIKFDLDTPNPYTRDISDDPHPRRQWCEPWNRTIGAAERNWMVDVVAAVREAVGPDIMVAMDAHWKFSTNDAILLAQALEPFDLLWLEDPVPPENIEAQRMVTHSTRTPICTGENLYRKHGFRELIEKQAARIIAPDIPKMGGLMEAKKVADWADTYYIPVAPHNVASPIGTVASSHVCAAMNNFLVIEFHAHDVEWWKDLVDGTPPIVDGFIAMTDAPGHGLTLNEDVARANLKPGSSFFGEYPYEC
ncbi:MAG: mandelate racemase/muconate lactonizing enzyme family protein [Thermomicrobiales bacterium]|nr:mandelate racemase/muconate lactonizing enzyme family protein [Thermomicrobiales bacterium]MCO5221493.1 mandelate racemase/muconate lactonizing enzyme family protein [Thermomicrobiales bacterium]